MAQIIVNSTLGPQNYLDFVVGDSNAYAEKYKAFHQEWAARDMTCKCGKTKQPDREKGCIVIEAAPANYACRCEKKPSKCTAEVTTCRNRDSPSCINPSTDVLSCIQGGGDCEGYATPKNTCECEYDLTSNSCRLKTAAPPYSACRCDFYEGTNKKDSVCLGVVTHCLNPLDQLCAKPDTSLKACTLAPYSICNGYTSQTCECDFHSDSDGGAAQELAWAGWAVNPALGLWASLKSYGGGCKITSAAPAGFACFCTLSQYKGKCAANVVSCLDSTSDACTAPTTEIASCFQAAGGNCGGYGCKCKYFVQKSNSGCQIIEPAPAGAVCGCTKTTCYASTGSCLHPTSDVCLQTSTDASVTGTDYRSCMQGVGHCDGYNMKDFQCSCTHAGGGCIISNPAPWGLACKCVDQGVTFPWIADCDARVTRTRPVDVRACVREYV